MRRHRGEVSLARVATTPRTTSRIARDDGREARLARGAARGALHAGSEPAVEKQRAAGKLLARERAEKLCDPGTFVELDRYVRHRETSSGWTTRRPRGRRGRHRLRRGARPAGHGLQPGLHRLRRLAIGGGRREGLQGARPGGEVRLPGDRDQRLGRRAHPGGRRLARRLRGDLLAQRAALGRRAAALARDGAVRGRRRLLARDDRLRADGRGLVVHVHHRPRRGEDRDRRGGDARGARRRRRARDQVGRRAPDRGRRRGAARGRALPAQLPAAVEPARRRRSTSPPTRSTARRPSSTSSSPTSRRSRTTSSA